MNKKIFLSSLVVFVLSGISVSQAQAFSDVDESHASYEAIASLAEKNIVQGYEDGTFKPDQKINRAEFLKIITESIFSENEIKSCTKNNLLSGWKYAFFSDVNKDVWYANYVCQGKMKNFIEGYGDGNFRPGNNINYVEALKIIFVSNNDRGMANPVGKEWYSAYLESVNAYYLGLDVALDKELTRGEMAELIYGYMNLKKIGKYAKKISSNEDIVKDDEAVEIFDNTGFYKNEELGFGMLVPNNWQDYELKTYEISDGICEGVTAEIYYFLPKDKTDFKFNPNVNQIPLSIIRYKKEEYCNTSYQWRKDAMDTYNENDPTADPMMIYLGLVYSHSRTLQNDEYLYQINPWQMGETSDNFIYTADPLEISLAVSTFTLME